MLFQDGYGPDAQNRDPIGAYLVKIPASGKNADAGGCLLLSAPRIELPVLNNREIRENGKKKFLNSGFRRMFCHLDNRKPSQSETHEFNI